MASWLRRLTAVAAASGAGAVWSARRRWRRDTDALVAQLVARARNGVRPAPFSDSDLAGLPPPVERFFRRTLHAGQPLARHVRMTWTGQFNLGRPGRDKWKPFTAEQHFVPAVPGFVWDARVAMLPGLPVLVRDALVGGHARMQGAVLGLVPVVQREGTPELLAGALQRYLGEAQWLPTALLPRAGVSWAPLDDTHARASVTSSGTTVSLDFTFDADGRIVSAFTHERFYDDGKTPPALRPWGARNLRFGDRAGITVAEEAIVEWHLPGQRFPYWKGTPVAIDVLD